MGFKKRLIGYYRYTKFKASSAILGFLPDVIETEIHFLNLPSKDFVFAAADRVYFKEFGKSFIESTLTNTDQDVHIHLYNPEINQLDELKNKDRISISYEITNDNPVLYQSARFVAFKDIIEKSCKSGLLLDIDVLISAPIVIAPNVGFAYFDRFYKKNKDVRVLAGALFSSPEKIDILLEISGQLEKFIKKGVFFPMLDQLVLYEVLKDIKDQEGIGVLNEIVSLRPDKDKKPILYFKGSTKESMGAFPNCGLMRCNRG